MISNIFNAVFYQPLYNALIGLMSLLPFLDAGVAVILFTFLVRLALFPLSRSMMRTQNALKVLDPEIKALKEKHKGNSQQQAEHLLTLYKQNNINPFSGIILALAQLPIILALYFVFQRGFSTIDTVSLYSFIAPPASINLLFLGLVDVAGKNILLAILVGASGFLQSYFMPTAPGSADNAFTKSLQLQMRYMFPVLTGFISYQLSAAISLYWITSNMFSVVQELFLRKRMTVEKKIS
ncbi:MAG: YidC/Oxa1 family membrane protein insertase [Patescibacteria group bacterium]